MQETRVQSLCWKDSLAEGMATHSSILVWRIPWTEGPGGLQSIGLQRVGHDWARTHRGFRLGVVLCLVECLAMFLASAYWMPVVLPFGCDNVSRRCQMYPGGNLLPIKNTEISGRLSQRKTDMGSLWTLKTQRRYLAYLGSWSPDLLWSIWVVGESSEVNST